MRNATSGNGKEATRRELPARAARLLGPQVIQKLIEEEFPCQDVNLLLGCRPALHNIRCAAARHERAQRLAERVERLTITLMK